MANIIVASTVLLIIGLAIYRIILDKRKGMKCVGCHLSGSCSTKKTTTMKMGNHINIKELT